MFIEDNLITFLMFSLSNRSSKRRDQESSYIEELAELITASLSGPESLNMKPDKFSRLQETINQFKRIKQQQGKSV